MSLDLSLPTDPAEVGHLVFSVVRIAAEALLAKGIWRTRSSSRRPDAGRLSYSPDDRRPVSETDSCQAVAVCSL